METFNVIVGVVSILAFFVSLYAVNEVIKIKKKITVTSSAGNVTQTATGDNNNQAGGNITNG